jgi:hypothetical protein
LDNSTGFFENQAYLDIKVTSEWNSYEIKGTVNPDGKTLILVHLQKTTDFILMILNKFLILKLQNG